MKGPELLHEAVLAEIESLEGEVLKSLLPLYFEGAAERMTELSGAIGRGDTLTVGQTAHELNGSSGSLGASHVSHIASELEATANAGDLTVADELLDRLRSAIDDTKKAFRSRLAESGRQA